MEFKDWLGSESREPYDAYDNFLEMALSGQMGLDECGCSPVETHAEFTLDEAKTPWGSETWLDDSNQKIKKTTNIKAFTRGGKKLVFHPFIINLLPARQSGINLCICATKHCAATCLHTAGAVQFLVNKTMGRLRKSWFIALDRDKAFKQIVSQIGKKKAEMDEINSKSDTEHHKMVVRLNGTSDLIWRVMMDNQGRNIFDIFPDIMFYDYSKHPDEMDNFIRGEIVDKDGRSLREFPSNHHLTLSYGGLGGNMEHYKKTVQAGENLAVPFGPGKTASLDYMEFPKEMTQLIRNLYYPDHVKTKKERESYRQSIIDKITQDGNFASKEELAPFAGQALLPGLFMCHEVVNGDEHDARFLDDILYPRSNLPTGIDDNDEMEVDEFKRTKKRHGLVIGLTAKGDLAFSAYKGAEGWDLKHTGFMVGPDDKEMNSPCRPMLNDPSREPLLRKKTEVYKKVARAIMTIRNFDARHVHAHEKDEAGNPRTHVSKGSAKPTQTYFTSKGRATREMNQLIGAIQAVMKGDNPSSIGGGVNKIKGAAAQAAKLRDYLMKPEVIRMLNDEDFKRTAKEFGIDVNFESLAKLAGMDAKRDPDGPKRTLLPQDTLKILGGSR